ncbi:MAG: DUF5714 domain-containing protein [Methanomassiliicoccales archaeon]
MDLREAWRYDDFVDGAMEKKGLSRESMGEFASQIPEVVLSRREVDPAAMYEAVMEELARRWKLTESMPLHAAWHHGMVPAILLTALRNGGYLVGEEEIEEAFKRGMMIPGGGCGFHGVCGAGNGLGIVASILIRATPLHDEERSKALTMSAKAILRIGEIGGPRCCPRATYATIQVAASELREMGYELLITDLEGRCRFSERNPDCAEDDCPFHLR